MPTSNINYSLVPAHCRVGVQAWIEHGRVPGGFLQAVIKNDLFLAAVRADQINAGAFRDYAHFFYNETPSECYGSKDNFDVWKKHEGLAGRLSRKAS